MVGQSRVFGCRVDPSNNGCASGWWSVNLGVSGCRVGRHYCDVHFFCLNSLENLRYVINEKICHCIVPTIGKI